MSKYAIGDDVTIYAKIVNIDQHDFNASLKVEIFGGTVAWVNEPKSIATHTPRSHQKGDRVKICSGSAIGTIESVRGGYAWIWWDSGTPGTYELLQIQRIVDAT